MSSIHHWKSTVATLKGPRLVILLSSCRVIQHVMNPFNHSCITLDSSLIVPNMKKPYHFVIEGIIRCTILEILVLLVISGWNCSDVIASHVWVGTKCITSKLTKSQTLIAECLVNFEHIRLVCRLFLVFYNVFRHRQIQYHGIHLAR